MKIRGNPLLKKLDAIVGRALIFLLRVFKKRRSFPQNIDSIGVLKLAAIGDLVLLAGILHDIRLQYPKAKIILFCGRDNQPLTEMLTSIHEVVVLSAKNPLFSIRQLRRVAPSLLLDFGQWSRLEALFSFFSKSRYRIGFQTRGQHRHFLYDAVALHRADIHEIDNYRTLAKLAKVGSSTLPFLKLKKEMLSWDLEFLQREKFVLFHPWSAGSLRHLKEWPLSSWIELSNAFLAKGYHVLLSGGIHDFERGQMIAASARVYNLAGKLSLNQLGHLIQSAHCVISVNTGILHFAACFDVPLIELHGPTSVLRWGSLNPNTIAIGSEDPESGYIHLGFELPKKGARCMEKLFVQNVLKTLYNKKLLDEENC